MSAPFVATSRLSNIIQMIGLSQQSGILRVVRVSGSAREVGQIRFTRGEPVSALLGPLVGPGALNVLSNWGECSYAFDETGADDPLADLAALSADSGISTTSGSWPTYQYPGSNPASGAPSSPSAFPPIPGSFESPALSYPTPGAMPSVTPDLLSHTTGQALPPNAWSGSFPSQMQSAAAYYPAAFSGSMPSAPATTLPALTGGALPPQVLAAIPARSATADHPEQLPLDRHERMLLLLVDGQRTVADLMRLTRRSEWEVYNVLRHLQLLGLIGLTMP